MEKAYEFVKSWFVNFKLDLCCWLAPVRVGLLIIGYMNITVAYISLFGIADGSFDPLLVQFQQPEIPDDDTTKSKRFPAMAYATELAFNVVLLCAIHRKDMPLLRVYMMYSMSALVISVLVYSMAKIDIYALALVMSIIFQVYVLVLVRSLMVEMKFAMKNLELPTLILSSHIQETEDPQETKSLQELKSPHDTKSLQETKDTEVDVETPIAEPEPGVQKLEVRLETVDECPKEETTNEKK